MGVRGLYSLLSKEPTRFGGHSWCSSSKNMDDIDIYIDAPALHHYLIQCHVQKEKKITTATRHSNGFALPFLQNNDYDHDDFSSVVVSPCTMYKLARNFLQFLLKATSDKTRIYVVLDGVASIYKQEQQLERMQKQYATLNHQAAHLQNRAIVTTVPHLYSFDAMSEAVQEEQKAHSERIRVHVADSEAESFIANLISLSERNSCAGERKRDHVVVSNDSDFLVFPSVEGFVPLDSLKYQTCGDDDAVTTTIWGWEYTRQQFLAAYPNLEASSNDESFVIWTTLAALAGCDYVLPCELQQRLDQARNYIVQSDIAGLRQRDRNNPSSRKTLLAIIRYTSHFRSNKSGNNTQKDWLTQMVESIVLSSAKGRKNRETTAREVEHLFTALDMIRNVYSEGRVDGEIIEMERIAKMDNSMVDLKRLILHRTLYCKPILEKQQQPGGAVLLKRQHRKRGKGKKRKSGIAAPMAPMNASSVKRNGERQSRCNRSRIWMLDQFVECRDRLYAFIFQQTTLLKDNVVVVTEYCGASIHSATTCQCFEAVVTLQESNGNDNVTNKSFYKVIASILAPAHVERVEHCLERLRPLKQHQFCLLASLLLKQERDVLFLLMLMLIPKVPHDKHNHNKSFPKKEQYLQSMGRIQVALFHVNLVVDAAASFTSQSLLQDEMPRISPSVVFCDYNVLVIWSSLQSHLTRLQDDNNTDGAVIVQAVMAKVCRKVFCHQDSKNDLRILEETMDCIWQCWLQLNRTAPAAISDDGEQDV